MSKYDGMYGFKEVNICEDYTIEQMIEGLDKMRDDNDNLNTKAICMTVEIDYRIEKIKKNYCE